VYLFAVFCGTGAWSQPYTNNVGIGTTTPDPSAVLELQSTDKGLLIPRLTQQERDNIAMPATGLVIYNTSTNTLQYNIGTKFSPIWVSMLYINVDGGSGSNVFWSLMGNDSVNPSKHFLGTTNQRPLIIKTDNTTRMVFTPTGEVEITGNTLLTGELNLGGQTSALLLDGNAGVAGHILVSRGPGATPKYTDSLSLSSLLVTGPATFTDSARFSLLPEFPLQYGNILVGDTANIARPLSPGMEGSLLQVFNGTPTWVRPDQANYWSLSGNTGLDASNFLGTLDATDLQFATNSQLRARFTAGGDFVVDVPTAITGTLSLNGTASALVLNGNAGVAGEVLVSQGTGATPTYTSKLTLTELTVSGPALFTDTATFTNLPVLPLQTNHLLVGNAQNIAAPLAPAGDSTFLAIFNGQVQWFNLGLLLRNTAWIVGGNTAVQSPILGNLDTTGVRNLELYAGGRPMIVLNGTAYTTELNTPVNLNGANLPLSFNGNAGSAGQVVVSSGPGLTPRYTDSLQLSSLTVTGESFFADTTTFGLLPRMPLTSGYMLVGDSTNHAVPMAPGMEGSMLQVYNGVPTWVAPAQANYWSLDGNAGTGTANFLGTTDANDLRLATNSQLRATFTAGGDFLVDVPTAITGTLSLNGTASALVLNGNAGVAGEVLVSQGAGATPAYTSKLTLTELTVSGPALFTDTATFTNLPVLPLQNNYLLVGNAQNIAAPLAPAGDSTFLAIFNGQVQWFNLGLLLRNTAWNVGGNTAVQSPILGNRDTTGIRDLELYAGGRPLIVLNGTAYSTTLNTPVNLNGANLPLSFNGNAGSAGQVVVSSGPGLTPRYTDSLQLSTLTVTGESFFADTATFGLLPVMPLTKGYMLVGDSTNHAVPMAPGLEGSMLQVNNGVPTWVSPAEANYWSLDGNAGTGAANFLGTTDGNDLRLATNSQLRATFTAGGEFFVETPTHIKAPLNLSGTGSALLANGDPGTNGWVLISKGANQTPAYTDSLALRGLATYKSLDIRGDSSRLYIDGSAGDPGDLLVSGGPAAPPRWTDSLTLAALTVIGESNFLDTASFSQLPRFPLLHGQMVVGDSTNTSSVLNPGLENSMLEIRNGEPAWVAPQGAHYWSLSGNNVGSANFLGTTNPENLNFATNNVLRLTIGGTDGNVTVASLAGPPSAAPLDTDEGIVVADAAGKLTKRDKDVLLGLLGISAGRYENTTAAPQFTVVITMPTGFVLNGNASISITPEATSSVSITPFVIAGSRTASTFSISFPGGLNPGEAINWLVKNP